MAKLVSRTTLRPLDYILIIGPILTAGAYSVLSGEFDVLGFIVLVAGVMGVVLSAKRSILNFLFGLVNVGVYAYIAYKSQYYGGAALHALYYVPMQFVGYFAWRRRHQSDDESRVQSRSMTGRQIAFWSVVSVVAIAALTFVLDRYTEDSQPLKDAAITVIAVVAQYLMTCAFWEQMGAVAHDKFAQRGFVDRRNGQGRAACGSDGGEIRFLYGQRGQRHRPVASSEPLGGRVTVTCP